MICALPDGITSVIRGDDTTRPSRTIATWFVGSGSEVTLEVRAAKAVVPSPSNTRLTDQALPACVSKPAEAFEI